MGDTTASRAADGPPAQAGEAAQEAAPGASRLRHARRHAGVLGLFAVVLIVGLYYVLPQVAGLEDTWRRIERGQPVWLLAALVFTAASFAGYLALFRGVFLRSSSRLGWRESYQITMAGLAAARLFAAGGAGGVALTAWALRQSGMPRREVADKSIAFLAITYAVYALAVVVFGLGLTSGVLPGASPWAMTVVPALAALGVLAAGVAVALIPTDLQLRYEALCERGGRIGCWAQRVAHGPASASAGVREAIGHLRACDPAVLGGVGFWAMQIAVVWAAFEAFGASPPLAVLVVGFFVGMLGNLLPMPGGVGGVEGGMIAAYAAFGVDAGLAVVAVLVYRAFVFWLPTLPGIVAYVQLRRTVARWRARRPLTVSGSPPEHQLHDRFDAGVQRSSAPYR
jgi:uncharacterized membrane protein YbhN (UPF0104 family)